MSDFKVFESTASEKKREMKNAVSEMVNVMPHLLEVAKLKAEYKRKMYNEYIEQGFSEKQALEIVKAERTPFDQ